MAGLLSVCALLFGCVYPHIELKRYDLKSEGGTGGHTVNFSFLLEGAPSSNVVGGGGASPVGPASRSVLPGAFTQPAAYKVTARVQTDDPSTAQTAYLSTATGGGISIPSVAALTVDVSGYSAWDDTSRPPNEADLILQRNGILFDEDAVRGGTLHITLNPLAHGAVAGSINLKLAWPATVDFDDDTVDVQGITRVTAHLVNLDNSTIDGYTSPSFETAAINTDGANKTVTVEYSNVPAGAYKLRLSFFWGDNGNLPAGYFTEVVTVWPGNAANTWVDAHGIEHNDRLFTQAEFYSAAASVASITIKKGTFELPQETAGRDNVVKAAVNLGENITFTIRFDAAGVMSGKSLRSVQYFKNGETTGTDCTGNFLYIDEDGGYVSQGNINVAAGGAPTAFRVEVRIQAPNGVTTKTYIYTFATVKLEDAAQPYYLTIAGALDAATGGTADSPNVITVLADMQQSEAVDISTGKHIQLTVPQNISKMITIGALPADNVFTVQSGASLTFAGNGTGVLTVGGSSSVDLADKSLIKVSGGTLNLHNGSVLQNVEKSTNGADGCIWIDSAGTVTMTGGTITGMKARFGAAVYVYNGTFTMSGGELYNNEARLSGGAVGIPAGNSANSFTLSGTAIIRHNRARDNHGGAVYMSGLGTFTMSGGTISDNTAKQNGGAVCLLGDGIFKMSGGTITDNQQTDAAYHGGGVCINNGSFTMSGGAVVNANNDVFLNTGKTVTVNEPLTAAAPVATITPSTYQVGTGILTGTHYAANHTKFAVTPNGTTPYLIRDDGKLYAQLAFGGTVTTVQDGGLSYEIHTFTSSGSLVVNTAPVSGSAQILIVAGGGGGGFSQLTTNPAGGGGAGGLLYLQNQTLTAGTYSVTVGVGGAGGAGMSQKGSNGGNSVFGAYTAIGGGGGGFHQEGTASSGNNGGSGGGSAHSAFGPLASAQSGQGHQGSLGQLDDGYYKGGAGGGAGAAASGATGGAGLQNNITGANVWYAGGGSGGHSGAAGGNGGGSCGVNNGNGIANTGGGGAGGRNTAGGNGGSGIVIVRFPIL
ncbi:MAG: hypothetical protein LBD20_00370 [Spirochaetaceae bacterium]|nr:hypothetical protein [Spirochaetaceae bacterium]